MWAHGAPRWQPARRRSVYGPQTSAFPRARIGGILEACRKLVRGNNAIAKAHSPWRPGDALPRQSSGLHAIQPRKNMFRDSPAFGPKLLDLAVAFCASTGLDQAPALALSCAQSIDLR